MKNAKISIMNIMVRFILITLMFPFLFSASKKHFTDQRVADMIPKYFNREHNSPDIQRIRIYGKDNKKYLHLEINVNRNRYLGEMDFALYAMANIAQYAKTPFDKFVLIMYPSIRSEDPEMVEADAKCAINYLIHKNINESRWTKKCIKISSEFDEYITPKPVSSKQEQKTDNNYNIIIILILSGIGFLSYFFKRKK